MPKALPILLFCCAQLLSGQNEISKLITDNFNENVNVDSMARKLGYKDGDVIKVIAVFTVNEAGELTDIKARSVHPVFEQVAIRALSDLSKMPAPKVNGKFISQKYTLPINVVLEYDKAAARKSKKGKGK